ncbi:MAG TPA: hypothetical protein VFV50_12725 [Bdellovibrionales bacterium]|nr:hypothetical protein [Bdellovibrionales bacterium]
MIKFVLVFATAFLAIKAQAQVQKDFELNAFLIGRQGLAGGGLNNYVDDVNNDASTTEDLGKFSNASFIAGEIILVSAANNGIGARYTITGGGVSGTQSGAKLELGTGLSDFSLVLKAMTEPKKFQVGVGLTAGVSTAFAVTTGTGNNKTTYSAPTQPVARGFGLGRFNFGRFALHGEAGYLYARAPEVKNGDQKLTRTNGAAVDVDFSGVYLTVGIGFQF